jgi:hypothetical protein
MAKLSARGRTTVETVVKVVLHPTDPDIAAEVKYYRLMSDGKILHRRVVRWWNHKPTDRGWKVSAAHAPGNYKREGFLEYFAKYDYYPEGGGD